MTEVSLEAQKAALTEKLAALRMSDDVAHAVAVADQAVQAFKAEANAIEEQIAALDRETGVLARQKREAAADEQRELWLQRRAALVEESESYLSAVSDAEAATRALLDALDRTFASNARLAKLAQALSVTGKAPMSCNPMGLASRLGGRIAGLLSQVKGHRMRLGAIEWAGGTLYPPDRIWRDQEERQLAANLLEPILTKGKA
jgi:hypothetical protein